MGVRGGTKARREQCISVYADTDPDVLLFLRWVVEVTPPKAPLFPYSMATYRRLLAKIDNDLNIRAGWTPHSARAGFATEATAFRVPFAVIRDTMRHSSDKSLRTYFDIVSAGTVAVAAMSAGLSQAIAYARVNWLKYVDKSLLAPVYRC